MDSVIKQPSHTAAFELLNKLQQQKRALCINLHVLYNAWRDWCVESTCFMQLYFPSYFSNFAKTHQYNG